MMVIKTSLLRFAIAAIADGLALASGGQNIVLYTGNASTDIEQTISISSKVKTDHITFKGIRAVSKSYDELNSIVSNNTDMAYGNNWHNYLIGQSIKWTTMNIIDYTSSVCNIYFYWGEVKGQTRDESYWFRNSYSSGSPSSQNKSHLLYFDKDNIKNEVQPYT